MEVKLVKSKKHGLVALILGIIGALILVGALSSSSATNDAEAVGESIGKAIVFPSVVLGVIGVVFNGISFFMNNRTLMLLAAIFYTLSLIAMPLWGFVMIPALIASFVSFSKMPKKAQ